MEGLTEAVGLLLEAVGLPVGLVEALTQVDQVGKCLGRRKQRGGTSALSPVSNLMFRVARSLDFSRFALELTFLEV